MYKTTMPGWQMQITCDKGRLETLGSERPSYSSPITLRLARQRSGRRTCLYTHQLGAVNELVEAIEGHRD